MKDLTFDIKINVEKSTGRIQAVYFRIRQGKVAKTREFAGGNIFADYDAKGRLLGIEQLGPCEAAVFKKIASKSREVRNFLEGVVPPAMRVA